MGSLPLHPAIVHVPMGLAIIVPFIAVVVALALVKGKITRTTWLVVVALQAALLVGALVAINTGGREADKVERIVGEGPIAQHEEAAETFAWAAGITLAASIAVMVVPFKAAGVTALATALLMFGVMGLGVRTGHAGGRLVYVHGAAAAYRSGDAPAATPAVRAGDDDDDRKSAN